ncbi:HAD-IC family P-type ATPase [Bifidobacterium santillanense]|uniref:HAD-IC family P-type ATPase n=1 Tax=Bifidobacterium santillanense TaxID=2809028 RepID=UPI003B8456C8
MITSGEAIEEYAQSKAEGSLTALLSAAPRTAHVVTLPGVGRGVASGVGGRAASGVGGADRPDDDGTAGSDGSGAAAHPRAARNIAPIRDTDGFRHVMASASRGGTSRDGGAPRPQYGSHAEGEPSVHQAERSRGESAPHPARDGAVPNSNLRGDAVCALTGRDPETCDPVVAKADRRVRPGADSRFETVPVERVRLGDVIIVLPGETVPVDGELLSGSATLDLSAINGEPVPREIYAGARVMSGAVNGSTTLAMRATEVAADSQYQRILALVSQAQESRPAVVRTADRLAVPFTVISLVIAGVAWALAGTPTRFAQVLVLATPCPLLIAAPVAYIAGTGRLAAAGILIKTQDVLENLGRVTQVFFDKTGTLTVKQPQVVRVEMVPGGGASASRLDEDHVLMFAGVVEGYSVHVLAKGIAAAGREAIERLHARYAAGRRDCPEAGEPGHGRDYPVVTNVHEEPGKGISAEVNGHAVRVGRLSFAAAGDDGFLTAGLGRVDATSDRAPVETTADSGPADKGRRRLPTEDNRPDVPRTSAPIPTRTRFGIGAVEEEASEPHISLRTRFGMLAPDEMASYVAIDGRLTARIVLRDVPRSNAREALTRLHELGVAKLAMLTGDKRASAEIIAREVGIDEVHAELFPEDKVAAVRAATHSTSGRGETRDAGVAGAPAAPAARERNGRSVVPTGAPRYEVTMMVGDGVNDAPVLAAADLGVAMTDGTSTAASESAQVVIMNDDIAAVPRAIAIARRTRRVMLQAVVLGLALALVGMVAAAFDLIPVVVGAFLQEAIDVVSILWALTALLDRD